MDFYIRNIEALKKRFPGICELIKDTDIDEARYNVEKTKSGFSTVKIKDENSSGKIECYVHSRYDPVKEAQSFALSVVDNPEDNHFLCGFGLGYPAKSILQKLSSSSMLCIVEIDIEMFKLALSLNDFSEMFLDERVYFVVSNNEQIIIDTVKDLSKSNGKLLVYMPATKVLKQEFEKYKFLLEDYTMKKNSANELDKMMTENFEKNKELNCENVGNFFGKLKNVPLIIASAGPSLNLNKHLLNKLKDKAFIFSVGSALKPLMTVGVRPDMFCLLDPKLAIYNQISGYEDEDIPLVFLETANYFAVSAYEGPKFTAYNTVSDTHNNELKLDTGGSVATAVMDMAIKFGANPIVFVGQDLAFTNNLHHADGSMYGEKETVSDLPGMRKIKGQNGQMLNSTLGYISFKSWIENKISQNPQITFYNATEGGAFIEGCIHTSLEAFINAYESTEKIEETIKDFKRGVDLLRKDIKVLEFEVIFNNVDVRI